MRAFAQVGKAFQILIRTAPPEVHARGRDMLSSEFLMVHLFLNLVSSLLASMLGVTSTCGMQLQLQSITLAAMQKA